MPARVRLRGVCAVLAAAAVGGSLFVAPAAVAAVSESPNLLVTEVMPDNTGFDHFEFFEVHNAGSVSAELGDGETTFAYTYVDSDDRSRDVSLQVPSGTVIDAGETVVFWLSYATGNVDSFAFDEDDFRAHFADTAVSDDYRIVRAEGQPGFANGGDRGVRVIDAGGAELARSYYPQGSVAAGYSADFRMPSSGVSAPVWAAVQPPSPGTVDPAALLPSTPEPTGSPSPSPDPTDDPGPGDRVPDASLVDAPLQITELVPDTRNVGGSDGFEFIEVHNTASEPIDFADYVLKYLFPLPDLTNSSTVLWPATVREAIIEPGGTIVFWIKNGPNDALTADDFNAQWGSSLTAGVNLFEISSAGMANGSPRGMEIMTNTGHPVNRAYYNMGGASGVAADRGIQYGTDPESPLIQTRLGYAPASPGRVSAEQVPPGLVVLPTDESAPVVTDHTEAEIDRTEPFEIRVQVTDDVQVKTVLLEVQADSDEFPTVLSLESTTDTFSFEVPSVDLTGKKYYDYTVTARDGVHVTTTETRRVPVQGADVAPLRVNVADGAMISGTTRLSAAGESTPPGIELTVDGNALATETQLENAPVFAFEAASVDTFFRNGVKLGDEVLLIFDDGIYEGWETISTPVPVTTFVPGETVTVSVWAGTKAAPEIDLDENNDDFEIRSLRLLLPDGRRLQPAGYTDPTQALRMGDSAGKLDFYDATFTIPDDAFTAVGTAWDSTTVADGDHTVTATNASHEVTRHIQVDNTAPTISTDLEEGRLYQGEFMIDATAEDTGSGIESLSATLDGAKITLPLWTSSIRLADGTHEVVFTATDRAGNTSIRSVNFDTPVEEPGNELISPADGAEVTEGEQTLVARATDPTDDRLDVSFREGARQVPGEGITASQGITRDAASADRDGAEPLTSDELESITRVDDTGSTVRSADALPYQVFDVTVPADAGPDAQVRARWDGTANADAQVILSVWNTARAQWEEVDRERTTRDATALTLEATVPVAEHLTDGDGSGTVMRLLVQHSEGFAPEARSERVADADPFHADATDRASYDFTLGWESDTQYYNATYYDRQLDIHDFFLDERDDLNLQYVFHTGDIVDDHTDMEQWANADPAYRMLDDAGLPYGVLAGNHDVGHKEVDYTTYGEFFGADRFSQNPWWGGDYENNRGHYDLLSIDGVDFLMMYMGWGPGDDEIAWMNEVLAQYPERVAIINLHEYMLTTGGLGPIPQRIYDEVVATNPNVRMVMSGHYHDAFTRVDGFDDDGDGVDDRQVYQMLFDYQALPEGGQAFLRLMHFDNEAGEITVRTYSPYLEQFNSDDPSLEPEHQDFTIAYSDVGIAAQVKELTTDAVSADVLTTRSIAEFTDVESGSELSAVWSPPVGTHDWFVTSTDPYGATSTSEVRRLIVTAKDEGGNGGGNEGAPDAPSVPVPDSELDPADADGIRAPGSVFAGQPFTVTVGSTPDAALARASSWVQLWLQPGEIGLGGWAQVTSEGTVGAVVPAGTAPGRYRLVAQDASDEVIGWVWVEVLAEPTDPIAPGRPDGSGDGGASGPEGSLPQTGLDPLPLIGWSALAVFALGVGAVLVWRRRSA